MRETLKKHWPEYLMEGAGLGIFMVSAAMFTILLYHPESAVVKVLPNELPRRILTGLAMGLTAIGIIYSPWGKRSGAHLNPAVTFTFWRLGKVAPWDAIFYVAAQFAGGLGGMSFAAIIAGRWIGDPSVSYAVTTPGPAGTGIALLGEAVISFILMTVVLTVSNLPKLARFTGLFAGISVALFITFESPLSGMSMNPARTTASAFLPGLWNSVWIYFVAPPVAMLLASILHTRRKQSVACAKMHHQNAARCIFCEYHSPRAASL